jgi:hypothetical protein
MARTHADEHGQDESEQRPARPELVAVEPPGAEDEDVAAPDDVVAPATPIPEAEGSGLVDEPAGAPADPSEQAATGSSPTAPGTAQVAAQLAADAASGLKNVASNLARSRRWMVRDTPNSDRLRSEISRLAAELPGLAKRAGRSGESWAPSAEALAIGASEALGRGDNLEAWDLLWAGEREAIDGLRPEEVRASAVTTLDRARALLEPAVAKAAEKELAPVESAPLKEARTHLREGRLLVDRLALEVFRHLHQEARRISGLSMLAVGFLLAGAVATLAGIPAAAGGDALSGASAYLTVVVFGAAGAVISMIVPWREKISRPVLVDFVNPVDLMVLRISLGAAFALIFVAVMQADVLSVVQIEGAKAYPWALAAGFSERLIDRRLVSLDQEARDLESY